ncbi:YbaN family protein [Halovulum marinum]|uniref:YbaN family protein n=1 Tax=Halovulum marinum TaxID=2662447 RepID=UPI002D78E1BD|nr:YbaN family protein [Halovulum marinum]
MDTSTENDTPAADRTRAAGAENVRTAGSKALWTGLGCAALLAGVIGALLPVIPTAPFIILAALAFGKGSPALRQRIMGHRHFGPIVDDWERTGAIAPRWKAVACAAMAVSFAGSVLFLDAPHYMLAIQGVVLAAAAAFVLSRPNR